jgi:hypothetical protein
MQKAGAKRSTPDPARVAGLLPWDLRGSTMRREAIMGEATYTPAGPTGPGPGADAAPHEFTGFAAEEATYERFRPGQGDCAILVNL